MTHIPDEAVQAAIEAGDMEGWDHIDGRMRDALTSALHNLSAPCAVEVKKLEWVAGANGSFNCKDDPKYSIEFWEREKLYVGSYTKMKRDPDLNVVKASLQADFERRILSCVVTKPVDVAAVRETPVNIDKLIAELKSAEDMCFSWSGSALLANELNGADTDEGHISLYKDLCGLGNAMSYLQSELRALSSEPAQGEQSGRAALAQGGE